MVDICACDVEDKEKLALFRLKRTEWKECLLEGDLSIANQITNMLWNDTVFRTFDETRRLTTERKTEAFGFNAPLLNLLDQGYLSTQVMSIRRLTDPNFHDPNKAIISLPRLIDDMQKYRDIITRENYICYKGNVFNEVVKDPEDFSKHFHWTKKQEYFDKLADVSAENRQRTDKISETKFKALRKKLEVCQDLRTYANKFIAHASDPKNRTTLTDKQKNITRQHLDEAYIAIIRVSSYLSVMILYETSLGDVPKTAFNQVKNLDKPMLAAEDLNKLRDFWKIRTEEIASWGRDITSSEDITPI